MKHNELCNLANVWFLSYDPDIRVHRNALGDISSFSILNGGAIPSAYFRRLELMTGQVTSLEYKSQYSKFGMRYQYLIRVERRGIITELSAKQNNERVFVALQLLNGKCFFIGLNNPFMRVENSDSIEWHCSTSRPAMPMLKEFLLPEPSYDSVPLLSSPILANPMPLQSISDLNINPL